MLSLILVLSLLQDPATTPSAPAQEQRKPPVTRSEDVQALARVLGIEFSESELKLMLHTLDDQREGYAALRGVPLANADALSFAFDPLLPGMKVRECAIAPVPRSIGKAQRPARLE